MKSKTNINYKKAKLKQIY